MSVNAALCTAAPRDTRTAAPPPRTAAETPPSIASGRVSVGNTHTAFARRAPIQRGGAQQRRCVDIVSSRRIRAAVSPSNHQPTTSRVTTVRSFGPRRRAAHCSPLPRPDRHASVARALHVVDEVEDSRPARVERVAATRRRRRTTTRRVVDKAARMIDSKRQRLAAFRLDATSAERFHCAKEMTDAMCVHNGRHRGTARGLVWSLSRGSRATLPAATIVVLVSKRRRVIRWVAFVRLSRR